MADSATVSKAARKRPGIKVEKSHLDRVSKFPAELAWRGGHAESLLAVAAWRGEVVVGGSYLLFDEPGERL